MSFSQLIFRYDHYVDRVNTSEMTNFEIEFFYDIWPFKFAFEQTVRHIRVAIKNDHNKTCHNKLATLKRYHERERNINLSETYQNLVIKNSCQLIPEHI